MLSDSILEGIIFQNFLGGRAPDPPRFGMLCLYIPAVCFARSTHAFYNPAKHR